MLKVVDGVPGSGKSYFMVQYLSKFFSYDKFYETFHIKDSYLIISNIEGLRIPHMVLDGPELLGNPEAGIEGKYTRESFFTIPNFEKLMSVKKVKNVILMIDECQRDWLFPAGYKHPDVMYFFQYHRHLGIDMTLGTQDAKLICRHALVCAEYIAKATARSKSVIGNFSYKFHDISGNFLYSKVLRKSQDIFRAYKSMTTDEVSKPKNVILYWAVICIAFLLIGGLLFKTALSGIKNKSKVKTAVTAVTPVQKTFTSARINFVSPAAQPVPQPIQQPFPDRPLNSMFQPYPQYPVPASAAGSTSIPPKPIEPEKPKPITVIGVGSVKVNKDSEEIRYLLSNGKKIKSARNYQIDDLYVD